MDTARSYVFDLHSSLKLNLYSNCECFLQFQRYQHTYVHCISLYLGVYGNVRRVKILYNKKDTALIQMGDGAQANAGDHFVLTYVCIRSVMLQM